MKLLIGLAVLMFGINITTIISSLTALAIVISGPAIFMMYIVYLHKSKREEFSFSRKRTRVIAVAVLLSMVISSGAMISFLLENPSLAL